MHRALVLLSACVVAVIASGSARASAAPQTLGSVAASTRIAAQGGWVVWSTPQGGAYDLVAWHDGSTRALPIAASPQPFDVDLGTDRRGRVVATFSRCAGKPSSCRVRVLDLVSGVERAAGIPRPSGTSDRNPSMWHGRIAFARHDPRRHGNVDQVLLWSGRTRKLTVLPHGAVPTNCPFSGKGACHGMPVSGTVTGLDLGASLVSFLWEVHAPAVVGHGGFEVRADRLSDRRSVLVGSGFIGEVCTGGPDGVAPSIPTSDGQRVWYAQLTSECYVYRSELFRFATRPIAGEHGPLAGIVLQVVKDRHDLYALIAPPNAPNEGPACTAPGSPCTIERIAAPPLAPLSHRPTSPFFS
jgi:hypothetical protein